MREKKMLRRTAAGMIAAVLMAGGISTVYAAETPGLSLGNDGAVAAEISLLQPDSTYYFPVQYTREDGRLVAGACFRSRCAGAGSAFGRGTGWGGDPHLERTVLCASGNRRGYPGR